MSKVAELMAEAERAYEAAVEDARAEAWFEALPTEDLTALWGVACVTEVSWDDEVHDALAARGWFDQAVTAAPAQGRR